MNRPLTSCAVAGSFKNTAADFIHIVASLRYQVSALGMHVNANESDASKAALSFNLTTPHTQPVSCDITRWSDAARLASITENIIQAACGIMSVHGRTSGKPQSLGLNYVSSLTAALALQGCFAAAFGQLRGLPATSCSISVSSAALLSMAQYLAGATAPEIPETILPDSIPHTAAPPFMSSDGVCFELETLDAGPWQKFWAQLGISPALSGKGWKAFMLRYAKAISPLPGELSSALSKHSYQYILEMCAQAGMSICPLRSVEDRTRDVNFSDDLLQGPWAFECRSAHCHRDSMSYAENKLPLSGITVIESCRRIQGPLAGHLLALLGADVIRVEPPGGDPLRGMPPMADGCSVRFDALNRLKSIREIDIKSASGKSEIKELVRHADVFLHNWAPGKAAKLSLDYSDFVDLNPALIYAYAAGWSTNGSADPLLSSIPGTDFMTQAYSGIAQKISQASDTRGGSLFTILDILGGVIAAQGMTVALLKRELDHVGMKMTSSLMSAATLLCIDDFQDFEKYHPPVDSKSIIDAVFATRHGKLAIECPDRNVVDRLAEALSLTFEDDVVGFQQQMQNLLLTRTAEEWVLILETADVPAAHVVEDIATLQNQIRLQPHLNSDSYTKVMSPWSFT